MKELDAFYFNLDETNQSCLLALRDIILNLSEDITPEWKFKLPFFYYKGKMFCYFWFDKKTKQPYVAFMKGYLIDHPQLVKEDRKRVKKLFIDPSKDLPLETILQISHEALKLY